MTRVRGAGQSRRLPLAALALAALVGIVLVALREPAGGRGAAPTATSPSPASDPSLDVSVSAVDSEPSEPERKGRVSPGRPEPATDATADPARSFDRGLRGLLEGADGEPFAGARVTVEPDSAGVDGAEPVAGRESDALGRFELGLEGPLGAGEWRAVARAPGRAAVHWRLPRPPFEGEWIELGRAVLVGVGALVVRPVDESGADVAEPVEVVARAVGKGPGGGSRWASVSGATTPGQPGVRFEGLPPGRHGVSASLPGLGLEAAGLATVLAGETVLLELSIPGLDLANALVVRAELGAFASLSGVTAIELLDRDGGALPEVSWISRSEQLAQLTRFEGLTGEEYRAQVRAPGFREVELRGLRPGERHAVELVGSAELELDVVDASGAAVEAYAVELWFPEHAGRARPAELATLAAPDADGRFEGVPALPAELAVRDAAGAAAVVQLRGLRPDQVAFQRVQLLPPATLVVQVVEQGTGAPLAGRAVSVRRILEQSDVRTRLTGANLVAEGVTDGAGRFVASGVSTAPLQIEVRPAGSPAPGLARWDPPASGDRTAAAEHFVRVELPAPGFARGRVLAPAGAAVQDLELMLAPTARAERGGAMPWIPVPPAPVRARLDPGGAFGPLELHPGLYRAALVPPLDPTEPIPVNAWIRARWIEGLELAVESGAQHAFEIDARATFPASATLRVTLDGAPAAGGEVSWSPRTLGAPSASTELDGLGRAEAQPVPPGTYALELYLASSFSGPALLAPLASEVVVRPGERLELELAVESFQGRVLLEFSEGEPASPSCTLMRRTDAGWILLDFCSVDDFGALELWLVAGDYRLDFGTAGSAEFRWPPDRLPLRLEPVQQQE